MRPVGVGLMSFDPIGVVGLRIITCWPVARGCHGFLLGLVLGSLIVPDHFVDRNRSRLIRRACGGEKAHGGYARSVDHAADALFAGNAQQFPGTGHVGGVHGFWIGHPKPVIGGYVHDRITTGNGAAQCVHPQQITLDCFCGEPG